MDGETEARKKEVVQNDHGRAWTRTQASLCIRAPPSQRSLPQLKSGLLLCLVIGEQKGGEGRGGEERGELSLGPVRELEAPGSTRPPWDLQTAPPPSSVRGCSPKHPHAPRTFSPAPHTWDRYCSLPRSSQSRCRLEPMTSSTSACSLLGQIKTSSSLSRGSPLLRLRRWREPPGAPPDHPHI